MKSDSRERRHFTTDSVRNPRPRARGSAPPPGRGACGIALASLLRSQLGRERSAAIESELLELHDADCGGTIDRTLRWIAAHAAALERTGAVFSIRRVALPWDSMVWWLAGGPNRAAIVVVDGDHLRSWIGGALDHTFILLADDGEPLAVDPIGVVPMLRGPRAVEVLAPAYDSSRRVLALHWQPPRPMRPAPESCPESYELAGLPTQDADL